MKPPLNAVSPVMTMLVLLAGHLGAQGCYEASILSPTPFMGNNAEILKLADGSLWEVRAEYEYLYAYNPRVLICPSLKKLIVGKKSLNVQRVSGAPKASGSQQRKTPQARDWQLFEETALEGSISGTVQKGRIFYVSHRSQT